MYILKPEMAEEMRNDNFEIFIDAPKSLNNEKIIVTIGDICTLKILQQVRIPNLCIVDYKTKRDTKLSIDQKKKLTILIVNP